MPKRKRKTGKSRATAVAMEDSKTTFRVTNSFEDRHELLSRINSDTRAVPLVVISRTAAGDTLTDPMKAAQLGAEVWVIDREAGFVITNNMGRQLTVYDGASRIFPADLSWQDDFRASPRFLASDERQCATQEAKLLAVLTAMMAPPPAATADPPASSSIAAPASYIRVTTAPEGTALAHRLLDPDRSQPVVVITIARGTDAPFVDPSTVADELRDVAPVYVMPTGAASWALADALPPYGEVYGGASRVYPPGDTWTQDPFKVPLRFASTASEGEDTAGLLIADALRHAQPSEHQVGPTESEVQASGTVLGMVAGRALIKLSDGQIAHAWPELVAHGVPPAQVFKQGQPVSGPLEPRSRRLRPTLRDAADALAHVAVGDVILTRVVGVQADLCQVEPFPGFHVNLPIERVLPDGYQGDLTKMITLDETIPVEVLVRGATAEQWLVSALVSDDYPVAEAPSLLPDGPPWLAPPTDEPEVPDEPPPPPAPVPSPPPAPPSSSSETDELRHENARLMDQVRALGAEITRLKNAAENQTKRIRKLERAKQQKVSGDSEAQRILDGDASRFVDPEEQLRFEVYLAWVRRFSDHERKTDRKLLKWSVGDQFFDSWAEVQGIERRKVVDVIVEVLTGLDAELAGRELHQLRTGLGGDDPSRTRGRDTAWRVSLQVGTPQARRLHYWRNDDRIELASIRHHDDYRT